MSDNRERNGLALFLTGIALGVLGYWSTTKKTLSVVPDEPVDELDLTEEGVDVVVENVTLDNSTLVDSLEGLVVDGTEADVVYCRVLGLERAKMVAMWGYKGLSGDDPTKFQLLKDLTTEHLLNIKANSLKVTKQERRIIDSILEDRVASGEADAAVLGL